MTGSAGVWLPPVSNFIYFSSNSNLIAISVQWGYTDPKKVLHHQKQITASPQDTQRSKRPLMTIEDEIKNPAGDFPSSSIMAHYIQQQLAKLTIKHFILQQQQQKKKLPITSLSWRGTCKVLGTSLSIFYPILEDSTPCVVHQALLSSLRRPTTADKN